MALLVILPGWGQTKEDWSAINEFSLEIPCRILELPGFGSTPLINDTWGIPEYAYYVKKQIEDSGDKEVILLGHSFGGRIAAYLASQQPYWLKALVLYGAPCLYRPSLKTQLLLQVAKIAKKLGFSKKLSRNTELHEADARGLGKIFRKTIGFDQTSFLPKISVKTLLLWGENDTEAPLSLATEMTTLLPHNELEIINNAGHNLHITNQQIFYGKLKNFLKTL